MECPLKVFFGVLVCETKDGLTIETWEVQRRILREWPGRKTLGKLDLALLCDQSHVQTIIAL